MQTAIFWLECISQRKANNRTRVITVIAICQGTARSSVVELAWSSFSHSWPLQSPAAASHKVSDESFRLR
jgi:hypothetical protein